MFMVKKLSYLQSVLADNKNISATTVCG